MSAVDHDAHQWEPSESRDDENEEWQEADDKPVSPIHSMTTYSDNREILEQSHRSPARLPIIEDDPGVIKLPLYARVTAAVLIVITFLSATLATLRIFAPR